MQTIEQIEQIICQKLSGTPPIEVQPLAGDASSRTYKRLTDANKQSWILMEFDSQPQSLAEEKTPGDVARITELPFVNIQKCLYKNKVHVPRIYSIGDVSIGEGYLLLEDLGDMTVYDWLQKHQPSDNEIKKKYERAVQQMLAIHHSRIDAAEPCIATTRKFDASLYFWEFEHFIEYAIEWLVPTFKLRAKLKPYFQALSAQLGRFPVCLTHRDFHSKNLMLKTDGSIWVIDFQDAIMAPGHYDLASLLFDSYVDLSSTNINLLTDYYWREAGEEIAGDSLEHFSQELRLMAMQRNMKAAGRFIYIWAVKKKPTHLPYFLPTIEKVRQHMKVLGAVADFEKLIPFDEMIAAAQRLPK